MPSMNETERKIISQVTHVDLGCGPAGQRIRRWLREGITTCVGFDIDLSGLDKYFLSLLKMCNGLGVAHPQTVKQFKLTDDLDAKPDIATKQRLVQIDATEGLKLIPDGQVQVVYGDFFFFGLQEAECKRIRSELARVLSSDGRVVVTQSAESISAVTQSFIQDRFLEREEAPDFASMISTLKIRIMAEDWFRKSPTAQAVFQK